jgi:hypothetical protein
MKIASTKLCLVYHTLFEFSTSLSVSIRAFLLKNTSLASKFTYTVLNALDVLSFFKIKIDKFYTF